MKQKLFTFLCLCILCIGSAWAGTVTLTNAQIKDGSGSTSYGNCSATDGSGQTWNAYAIKNQHSKATSNYNYWQIKKFDSSTAYYIQTPTFPGNITSITLTVSSSSKPMDGGGNSSTLYFSSSNSTAATGTGVASGTGASEITIDASSLGLKSGYITASGAIRIWEITVTYEEGNTPSISASNVDLAADATSGEIAYTISNPVEGKSLTAETSTEWISNVTVDAANSKVSFNTTANAGAQREGTITLKYDGATNKNVTITQAKASTFASIEALVAAGAPASDGTETVTVTLTDEVIKSFYTSSGFRNGIFLNYTNTEGKDIEIYCKNVPEAWIAGGTLSGTLENCSWKIYSGTWELCPADWTKLTYTAPATYAINIDDAIANGTVEASATESAPGVEVSLTVTPADHYELVSLSVKDKADNDIPVTDNKFTMPSSDVTVSATFAEKAKFTVSYNALGEAAGSEVVYDGELIASAPTPTLAGWELIGWTTNNAYETSTTAPTAFELSTPITEELTLYAVFKKTEGEGGTYVLDYDVESGLSSSTAWDYNNALDYTAADGSEWSVRAYKNKGMQLNKGKGAYIKIPVCSSKISSIELTTSAAQTINLGSTDNNDETIIANTTAKNGTIDLSSKNVTTGYLWSSTGTVVVTKIVVNYGNATTYYTTSGILTQDVAISAVGYSTYSSSFALTVPADETVYGAKIKNENSVELIPVEAGTVIAAGEGFIVKGEANGTVTFTVSSEAGATISGNELFGTGDETIDLEAGEAYLLAAKDGKAIFGLCSDGVLGENKACLPAPSGANSVLGFDDATGIIAVSNNIINNGAMYNLAGQKVGSDYKGIVIVNGMKFLNK